ncbi:hypothetical protein NKR23_g8670 [Pleurostoma richardsiae]|uniref:Uncharacterized protein n=1 Tax=Pleurostoma richardsiae TaxID=41990 RepID=A0AA38VFE5_9PEZI|nr:hypothetical protein NKR23_g8670 [Pleurostoma richardsiae]
MAPLPKPGNAKTAKPQRRSERIANAPQSHALDRPRSRPSTIKPPVPQAPDKKQLTAQLKPSVPQTPNKQQLIAQQQSLARLRNVFIPWHPKQKSLRVLIPITGFAFPRSDVLISRGTDNLIRDHMVAASHHRVEAVLTPRRVAALLFRALAKAQLHFESRATDRAAY